MQTVDSIGGESARKDSSRCGKKYGDVWRDEIALVCVIYEDHVLFRNEEPEKTQVSQRVAIGWIVYQDSHEIVLLMDRSLNPQQSERISRSSGLRILRSNILVISDVPKTMLDKLTSDSNVDRYTKNK